VNAAATPVGGVRAGVERRDRLVLDGDQHLPVLRRRALVPVEAYTIRLSFQNSE